MITQKEIQETLKQYQPFLKEQFKVNKIGLFGSFVRGEETADSDIDILVDVDPSIGWFFVDLKEFLEVKLGRKVDLVSIRAIKRQLRDTILQEVRYI